MKNKGCIYCARGEKLEKLMVEIVALKVSTLFLLKNQSFEGRCVLALNDHKNEIFELERKERESYFEDLSIAAKAIFNLFHPDKINYAVFGDIVSHFHIHLVPKYKKGPLWGKAFCEEPVGPLVLSDEDLIKRVSQIKKIILKHSIS